ncbi:hypothetical protein IC762_22500 [Bradyrhizobium genosp. L]|uniref:His-rich protein BRANT n=1 Tax=Bradyrhizobium genosp. L TaxID=83637 RepID=UPI0018A31210|nr:hypothetical protein [Bradyrhizobium genosp. L]QPF82518.1 hypothetical protein IC762_22500 [Bradyrhizobium genosp. L]
MLKTISAALVAISMIAAPALAAEAGKTGTNAAPVVKSEQLPAKVANANAKMGRHHHKQYRHHRHHKHMGMLKVKAPKHVIKHAAKHGRAKVAIKHVAPAKRG